MNPEDLPADECQRIVAEWLTDAFDTPGELDWLLAQKDRILALAPKPGPFPLELGPYSFSIDEVGDVLVDGAIITMSLGHGEMDRLVVAWLAHRGVDLPLVRDIVGGWEISNEAAGALGPRPQHDALRAVLDNAGAG